MQKPDATPDKPFGTRPRIVSSACLEFDKVRYNGQVMPSKIVAELVPYADFVTVCPEQAIGLGVPREPIRIVKSGNDYRLIQHVTNRDVTDDMNRFIDRFLSELPAVDGFILKSKSPTMGVRNVKVYSGMKGSPVVEKCGGFFAQEVARRYPTHAVEEDDRLRNNRIREHFLTQIFTYAAYRHARESDTLAEFHTRYQPLFAFYEADETARLTPADATYEEQIRKILRRPPSPEQIYRFYSGLVEHVSNRDGFHELLERYRQNRITLETVREALRLLLQDPALAKSALFTPYPAELAPPADDDRDRDYWKLG